MKNKTFTKQFWKYFSWFIVAIIAICFFPFCFTRYSLIDFTETGQIGDTIGGIMGPFIAIAAAGLTFLAFWVQYIANIKMQDDIAVERFESKFYKMLDIHIQNVANLELSGKKGTDVFSKLIEEYQSIYPIIESLAEQEIKESYGYILQYEPGINEYADLLRELEDQNVFKEKVTKLAYGYFFYGVTYQISEKEGAIVLFNARIRKVLQKYLAGISYHLTPHNDLLGHYYRHLYHTICYIANMDDVVNEDQKYEYAKMLRGQMTDQEQLLLYYNSLSFPGYKWNVRNFRRNTMHERKDMGYIARFRLIKNISNISSICGLNPLVKYAEEKEIWRRKYECDFFEQEGNL